MAAPRKPRGAKKPADINTKMFGGKGFTNSQEIQGRLGVSKTMSGEPISWLDQDLYALGIGRKNATHGDYKTTDVVSATAVHPDPKKHSQEQVEDKIDRGSLARELFLHAKPEVRAKARAAFASAPRPQQEALLKAIMADNSPIEKPFSSIDQGVLGISADPHTRSGWRGGEVPELVRALTHDTLSDTPKADVGEPVHVATMPNGLTFYGYADKSHIVRDSRGRKMMLSPSGKYVVDPSERTPGQAEQSAAIAQTRMAEDRVGSGMTGGSRADVGHRIINSNNSGRDKGTGSVDVAVGPDSIAPTGEELTRELEAIQGRPLRPEEMDALESHNAVTGLGESEMPPARGDIRPRVSAPRSADADGIDSKLIVEKLDDRSQFPARPRTFEIGENGEPVEVLGPLTWKEGQKRLVPWNAVESRLPPALHAQLTKADAAAEKGVFTGKDLGGNWITPTKDLTALRQDRSAQDNFTEAFINAFNGRDPEILFNSIKNKDVLRDASGKAVMGSDKKPLRVNMAQSPDSYQSGILTEGNNRERSMRRLVEAFYRRADPKTLETMGLGGELTQQLRAQREATISAMTQDLMKRTNWFLPPSEPTPDIKQQPGMTSRPDPMPSMEPDPDDPWAARTRQAPQDFRDASLDDKAADLEQQDFESIQALMDLVQDRLEKNGFDPDEAAYRAAEIADRYMQHPTAQGMGVRESKEGDMEFSYQNLQKSLNELFTASNRSGLKGSKFASAPASDSIKGGPYRPDVVNAMPDVKNSQSWNEIWSELPPHMQEAFKAEYPTSAVSQGRSNYTTDDIRTLDSWARSKTIADDPFVGVGRYRQQTQVAPEFRTPPAGEAPVANTEGAPFGAVRPQKPGLAHWAPREIKKDRIYGTPAEAKAAGESIATSNDAGAEADPADPAQQPQQPSGTGQSVSVFGTPKGGDRLAEAQSIMAQPHNHPPAKVVWAKGYLKKLSQERAAQDALLQSERGSNKRSSVTPDVNDNLRASDTPIDDEDGRPPLDPSEALDPNESPGDIEESVASAGPAGGNQKPSRPPGKKDGEQITEGDKTYYWLHDKWLPTTDVSDADQKFSLGRFIKNQPLSQLKTGDLNWILKSYKASPSLKALAQQVLDARAASGPAKGKPGKAAGKASPPPKPKKGATAEAPPAEKPAVDPAVEPVVEKPQVTTPEDEKLNAGAIPIEEPDAAATVTTNGGASQPPALPGAAQKVTTPGPSPNAGAAPGGNPPPPPSPPAQPPSQPAPKGGWKDYATKNAPGILKGAGALAAFTLGMYGINRLGKMGPEPIPTSPDEEADYRPPVTKQAATAPDQDGYDVPVSAAEPPPPPRPALPEQPQLSIHPVVAAMMQRSRQGVPAPAESEPVPVPASREPETIRPYRSMTAEERIRAFKGLNSRNYNSGTLSRY